MKVDFKYLDKNGVLKKEDYNKLTSEWLDLLNPVRVKPIRKYLQFTQLKYEVYSKEAPKSKPTLAKEDDVDLSVIPLYFVTTFSSTLFPDFQAEYFAPFEFLTNKNFAVMEGLKIVEPAQYHSLSLATYDIEHLVKQRFEGTKKFKDVADEVLVVNQFLIPFKIDSEFPMTIIINVNMLIK